MELDERVPAEAPWPGLPGARRTLAWSDSVAVIALPDPGGAPFEAPLVAVQSVTVARGLARAHGIVSFEQGSHAWEDNSLAVERGDSLNNLRVEVLAGSRGVTGSVGDGSRRLWDASARVGRGPHQIDVAYRQHGASGHLPRGLGQNAEGESGRIGWRWRHRELWTELALARGADHHESAGDTLAWSRREAGRTRGEAAVGGPVGGGESRVRLTVDEARVRRGVADSLLFDRDARAVWLALEHQRALGRGRLEGSLGLGRHDASGGTRLAPWLSWRRRIGPGSGRVAAGRWLVPVWSDVVPGGGAFVQSTWAGCAQWAADGTGWHADALVAGGRTAHPARVSRLPLEDLALRRGITAGDDARFALAAGGMSWTHGAWSGGAGGFGLGRDADGGPRVDPRWAARGFAGWRGSLFQGDLRIAAKVFGDAFGARVVDGPGAAPIPAYTTLGATLVLGLADATVVIEGANLEDQVRAEPWIDPDTGRPARGPGRELRLAVRLKLYN